MCTIRSPVRTWTGRRAGSLARQAPARRDRPLELIIVSGARRFVYLSRAESSALLAQRRLAHEPVRRLIGFAHPFDDFFRLWRILQLDADGAIDPERLDFAQIRAEIDDAATRRQVAVDLAVAVAQMDVRRLALQSAQLLWSRAG